MIRSSIKIGIVAIVLAISGWLTFKKPEVLKSAPEFWSASVQPGKLSKFHANLENNCIECHAPYKGVVREQCVTCHAAQTEILKKQNTSFHSSITSCSGCHFEHQGKDASITKMDHTHLALVASEKLDRSPNTSGFELMSFIRSTEKNYHGTSGAAEKTLSCVTCHANQDTHRTLFGSDCSSCHETSNWSISSFRHPSPASRDCSQCHQAPPSHYMMHFKMISEKVAGVEHAQVNQCFRCHQTTAWNDIKGVGWYKHH